MVSKQQSDPLDKEILEADWQSQKKHTSQWQRERWQREALGLRLSKSMMLRQFAVDFDRLPYDVDVTPPAALSRFFRFLAVFFLVISGIPLIIMIGLNDPEMPFWGYLAMAILPGVCIATIVICTRNIWRQRNVRFDADGVFVRQHGLGGAKEWQASYETFTSVALERKIIDTRYAERAFYLVLLMHTDPGKNVPMMITTNLATAEKGLHYYAQRVNLPIVEFDDLGDDA